MFLEGYSLYSRYAVGTSGLLVQTDFVYDLSLYWHDVWMHGWSGGDPHQLHQNQSGNFSLTFWWLMISLAVLTIQTEPAVQQDCRPVNIRNIRTTGTSDDLPVNNKWSQPPVKAFNWSFIGVLEQKKPVVMFLQKNKNELAQLIGSFHVSRVCQGTLF